MKNKRKETLLPPVPLTPEEALRAAMETPLPWNVKKQDRKKSGRRKKK